VSYFRKNNDIYNVVVHEAGHFIAGYFFSDFPSLTYVTVQLKGKSLGHTEIPYVRDSFI
jgi:hypothetical protein